jgi:tetratricopeptide (TPR) repeat protein
VEQIQNSPLTSNNPFNHRMHEDLSLGDWEGVNRTASEWLQVEPDQPVATFFVNLACLFINPPSMIQNKRYISNMRGKAKEAEFNAILSWFNGFKKEADRHNPYFQVIDFNLQPRSKKKEIMKLSLQDNPNNAELLFLHALAQEERSISIELLKRAVDNKPDFPAAFYLIGIFSLQMNQVQAAEDNLKRAVELAPNFLEAHYQLGSLYTLYKPNSSELAARHFQKVIELDPEGEPGLEAKKVLEEKKEPQYGQRIGRGVGGRRAGMSIFMILGISVLAVWLFMYPISNLFHLSNPTAVGIMAGLFVFIGLYSSAGRKKG